MIRTRLLSLALGAASLLPAATQFVSLRGSDQPSCGSASARCRTIGYTLQNRATADDTVQVLGGTFREHLAPPVDVTIKGVGTAATLVDGGGNGTVLTIAGGRTVTVANLTLQNGCTTNCGGGILNSGTLMLARVSVSGSRSVRTPAESPGLGGGICNHGTFTMAASTISSNSANEGGGIYNTGVLAVYTSTIANNSSGSWGGGVDNLNTATIVNSTLAGNGCIYGCGVRNIYALAIYSSTITGNRTNPGSGAGLYSDGDAATVKMANTVIAGNTAGWSNPDCNASITSLDYNFVGAASGCTLTGGGHDLLGGAALLGPLQNNGGPTQTVALLPGSLEIDAANPAGCAGPSGALLRTDQRGAPRSSSSNPRCDIGAYEVQQ